MLVEIDHSAGFCFGVRKAISKAEEILENEGQLNCLGSIVHNQMEVSRLEAKGMNTIESNQISSLKNTAVLLRSHGEAPETYTKLKANGNKVIDATCPVVLKLQQRVKTAFEQMRQMGGQLVIYGKKDHPETVALNGQTGNCAIIIIDETDLKKLDFARPIELFCQTTMPIDGFKKIALQIEDRAKTTDLNIHDTICRQVSGRVEKIKTFAASHELVLFVSGKKSSNGKFLFSQCKEVNSNSKFISNLEELNSEWFINIKSIGITGATSTPQWLMEKIKKHIEISIK